MRKTIRRLIIACLTVILVTSCSRADFEIGKTTTNLNPVAVGVALTGPQFGWQMMSLQRNVKQQAYRIVVASGEANLQAGNYDVWDSGRKTSSKSVLVPYKGKELMPGEVYYWRVKAWDNYGNATEWSQTGRFITKLNDDTGWNKAKWIALDSLPLAERIVPGIHNPGSVKEWKHKDHGMHKLPVLRKEVAIQKKVKSALAFICGLGQYEMFVNGRKVGKSFLTPGWTDYDDYVLYNTYDITSMLDKGANAIGVMLGNGFYNIPNVRYRKLLTAFGNPKMICLIKVKYEDGSGARNSRLCTAYTCGIDSYSYLLLRC
jgi:alpha-L-rhamnosidase